MLTEQSIQQKQTNSVTYINNTFPILLMDWHFQNNIFLNEQEAELTILYFIISIIL